jgi:hypothetical protein
MAKVMIEVKRLRIAHRLHSAATTEASNELVHDPFHGRRMGLEGGYKACAYGDKDTAA